MLANKIKYTYLNKTTLASNNTYKSYNGKSVTNTIIPKWCIVN